MYLIKRHPVPISAYFKHSLVLTYALPAQTLTPLLPPGVKLDTFGELGFVAIAIVQTQQLRPAFLPEWLGHTFILTGYRIFTRFETSAGRRLRGLRILRSDTDSAVMAALGSMFTHYHYSKANIRLTEGNNSLDIRIATPRGQADLHVVADLSTEPTCLLPPGSPFASLKEARRYEGPLPFTFSYEPQTRSIIVVEGVRQHWDPQPVHVDVREVTFFKQPAFAGTQPVLASAFHVHDIPYYWKRGVREPVPIHALTSTGRANEGYQG
ncbi:MAG TPA: DUF2071 domain-containing protein [Chloroflexia bacterium]